MIASFIGLVDLLGLLLLPQGTGAASVGAVGAAGPVGPNTNGFLLHDIAAPIDRHLAWSQSPDALCDAATLQRMQLINPNLSIVACLTSEIQWDPDAILVTMATTVTGTYRSYLGVETFDVQTFYTAFYTPTQGICQAFDRCFLLDSLELLTDQFTYDCSNVYCGENAIRDCNGNYQSVPCAQGRGSDPEIPTYAQVSCERVLASLSDTDRAACNPTNCQLGVDGTWSYTCQPSSGGGGGRCSVTVSRFYDEWFEQYRECNTDGNGNEFCGTHRFGPVILANNQFYEPVFLHNTYECMAEYNGQKCQSCTPCGEAWSTGKLEVGDSVTVDIDCSNFQANSRLNGCDQTATGILEFFYESDDLSCPSLSTPSGGTEPTAASGGTGPTATSGGTGPTATSGQSLSTPSGGTPGPNNDNKATSAAARGAAVSFATTTAVLVATMMGVFVVTSF